MMAYRNAIRRRMSKRSQEAFLKRFRDDCSRALRGGLMEEELVRAVHEAVVKEVQES